MARAARTQVCSSCIGEFPAKEMWTVARPMHRGADGSNGNIYYTPYCDKCKTKRTGEYLFVKEEPKSKKAKK